MSMGDPMTPHQQQPGDEVAAADPGAGGPPPAEGFGVGGEEPDRPEEADETGRTAGEVATPDTPFTPPDPGTVRRPGAG
jgi:hypothetical protein